MRLFSTIMLMVCILGCFTGCTTASNVPQLPQIDPAQIQALATTANTSIDALASAGQISQTKAIQLHAQVTQYAMDAALAVQLYNLAAALEAQFKAVQPTPTPIATPTPTP